MACARWSVSDGCQWKQTGKHAKCFFNYQSQHKSHKFISMYVYCRYSFGFPCNKQVKTIKDNNKYIPLRSASWYEPWSWQTCRELLLNSVWENDVDFNDYIIYLHTLCWRSACWRWVLDPCIILMSSHKILSCLVFCYSCKPWSHQAMDFSKSNHWPAWSCTRTPSSNDLLRWSLEFVFDEDL